MLLLAMNAVMRMHMVLPVNLVAWLVRPETSRRYGQDALYWDLFSDAVDRSIESVTNYGDMIVRAVGQHPPPSASRAADGGLLNEEQRARQFAGDETVEHGIVAVENAQDVTTELLEGLVKVLNEGLTSGSENDTREEWIRAGLSYLRGLLQKYLRLLENGINRAIPGTAPIFDAAQLDEVMGTAAGEGAELSPTLQAILSDTKRYVEDKQALGGEYAHGQIFSTEDK